MNPLSCLVICFLTYLLLAQGCPPKPGLAHLQRLKGFNHIIIQNIHERLLGAGL
jgi:hypothetical protein